MRIFFLIFFFHFFIIPAIAQEKRTLLIELTNPKDKKASSLLEYKKIQKDSISAIKELQKVIYGFHRSAYILASVDSLKNQGDTLIAYLNPEKEFRWSIIKKGNVNDIILNKVGFKERYYRNSKFSYVEYAKMVEAFLSYSDRHGYPFATIGLDSIREVKSNTISASLNYQPGPRILFDSIEILGKVKVKKKFIMSYLRIFPETPYNQDKIDNLNRLMKELVYLKQTKPYQILFTDGRAIIRLFLEEKRANQADGIVGFLPNSTNNNKMLVTGELNLGLKNLFNTGKIFTGEWKRFNQASQLLNLSYLHPRLLRSNLDLKLDFNLLKQDSSFITIDRKISLFQKAGKLGVLNFSGDFKTSRNLLSDSVAQPTTLPTFSNYDLEAYGIGYGWNNLDDVFFPHKGWLLSTELAGGNKNIKKSNGVPDSLFNSVALTSIQFNSTMRLEKYLAIGNKGVLLLRSTAATIYNNRDALFYNDLYRVGGLKSLRGFTENIYYASSYAVGTIEYRFFTEATSYLLLFLDQGYIKNKLNKSLPVDYPTGFGAGVSFSTGAGIFNFVYSLGNSKTQKINISQSKIHFGIVSRF